MRCLVYRGLVLSVLLASRLPESFPFALVSFYTRRPIQMCVEAVNEQLN